MNDPYNGRYCKDCAHSTCVEERFISGPLAGASHYSACALGVTTYDPVYGKTLKVLKCRLARGDGGQCGPEGKLFEPLQDKEN